MYHPWSNETEAEPLKEGGRARQKDAPKPGTGEQSHFSGWSPETREQLCGGWASASYFQGSNGNQPSRAQYLVPGMSAPKERARAPSFWGGTRRTGMWSLEFLTAQSALTPSPATRGSPLQLPKNHRELEEPRFLGILWRF